MDNPFSWDYLTTVPGTNEVFGPFAIVFLVLFGLGFLAALFFYNDGARRYGTHSFKRKTIRRGSSIAMTVFGIGLFFFAIRVLQINPFGFGMRLWLWLSLVAAVGMLMYFMYYLRTAYRQGLRAYEERRRKQHVLRPAAVIAGGRSGAQRVARAEPRRPTRRRRR